MTRQRAANALLRIVAVAVLLATFGSAWVALMGVAHAHMAASAFYLAIFPLLLLVTLLHESGHVAAAALIGAHVLGASVGPVFFERRRRGVRVRLRRLPRRVGGFAMVIPRTDRDVRRQVLVYVAGGPVANLATAAVCAACVGVSPAVSFSVTNAAIFAFGALNLGMGLINLLPISRGIATDGYQLLSWWRNRNTAAALRVIRFYDSSLRGVVAEEMPAAELDAFEHDDAIGMRFFGRYVSLRAAQGRGDRAAFDAILARCDAQMRGLDAATFAQVRALWVYFQLEYIFENTLAGIVHEADIDSSLLRTLPAFLRLRLAAAEARTAKDSPTWKRALARARRELDGVYDKASRRADARLLDRVERCEPLMTEAASHAT